MAEMMVESLVESMVDVKAVKLAVMKDEPWVVMMAVNLAVKMVESLVEDLAACWVEIMAELKVVQLVVL